MPFINYYLFQKKNEYETKQHRKHIKSKYDKNKLKVKSCYNARYNQSN